MHYLTHSLTLFESRSLKVYMTVEEHSQAMGFSM
jgi:hypothetical protein